MAAVSAKGRASAASLPLASSKERRRARETAERDTPETYEKHDRDARYVRQWEGVIERLDGQAEQTKKMSIK